jgi:Protein of unknown function (DUF3592)
MMTGSTTPTRPLTRGERIWLTIVYWGLVAGCVLFALVGWRLVHSQEAPLKGVLPVTATVLRSDVVAHTDPRGNTLEQPIVMYSYQVDGVRYSTDRVTLREASRSGHWAKDVAARFRAGDTVTAYYDPTSPGSAFLITERNWLFYLALIVPVVLAIALAALWPRVAGQASATQPRSA